MSDSVVVIMQGRLGSTRLPGKGLFTFFGQTIWERMCDIGKEIKGVNEVVFATGDRPENYVAKDLIEAKGVRFYAGSEENVLQRFALIAQESEADYVVRFTCDNYLIQPDVVEQLIAEMYTHDADYGYVDPLSHFAGEVIRRDLLVQHYGSGEYSEMAKEHVTWDLRHRDGIKQVVLASGLGGLNHQEGITLDALDDLVQLKKIESEFNGCRNVRCMDSVVKLQQAI